MTPTPEPLIVGTERRGEARRARITVLVIAGVCLVLAGFALLAFPTGGGTRTSLTVGAIVLAVAAALAALRLWRIARKADRLLGASGELLAFTPDGVTVAGDVRLPWDAISGVWALDRGAKFRAQVQRKGPLGALSRLMDRAGTNTIDLTIGVSDTTRIADPRGLVTRHAHDRGRVELPFGAWSGREELAVVMQALADGLQHGARVRYCTGPMDYASAWAGTADDAATIARREDEAAGGPSTP